MRRLRMLRLERFLTQKALAEKLGVPYLTVQRWEAGTRFPRPFLLGKLCAVLGVDVHDLVEPDEWPQPRAPKAAA